MAAHGTLESIAMSLGRLLQPLEEELRVGRVRVLFAELGLEFPPELESQAGLVAALERTVHETGRLPDFIVQLSAAIEAEDFSTIAGTGIELFGSVRTIVDGIQEIADELDSIGGSLPGMSPVEVSAFAAALPRSILDYLLVRNLESTPGLAEGLELIDAVEREDIVSGTLSYTRRTFNLDQLTNFIAKPGEQLANLYGWGTAGFNAVTLFDTVERLAARVGLPAIADHTGPVAVLDLLFLEAKPDTAVSPPGLEFRLLDKIVVESAEFALDQWRVVFRLDAALGAGVVVLAQSNGAVTFIPPSGEVKGEASLEWIAGSQSGEPYVALGQPGGSRLEARQASVKAAVGFNWSGDRATGDFSINGDVKGGKVVIDFSQGDGFLAQILSSINLECDFDLGFGYSARDGLFFHGSSELQIQLPLHLDLGPIGIEALTIGVGVDAAKVPLSLAADLKANLGPLVAVVQGMGVRADLAFPSDRKGNLGPVELAIGFKPPTGVGLSVDAGVVKGGGFLFFDVEREEYGGALELVFSEWIALKAIGLITTRMPDGSKGFSLLIIITVEFGTGIQLGFGFTLLGVGGLLGLHRIARIEALSEGVRTGAIESVMFPGDVIANAARIISDLRRFFPPQQGVFLVGPMAKIGWGTPTLVSVQLGLILEFPSVNITILGVIKVVLPHEDADILRLQVNFIGRLEPSNKLLWFYAELFDSRVLFITLEGGFGLLVNWGAKPNFVVTAGGFHPRYSPPPLPFPEPPRIAVALLNESYARIRIEGYFAVTSNSVQFGARAELFFGLSEFRIEGHLGFDALFQFDPFFFSFGLSVSLSVKVFGIGLFSVGFSGLLEGPTPWHIEGKGSIGLLFFSISVPFEHTWGDSQDTTLEPIAVFPLLEAEFNALTNWQAEVPAGNRLLVALRKLGESDPDQLVLHPVGRLLISQRKVPVNFRLDKVGNQKPADYDKFVVSATLPSGGSLAVSKLEEPFAIGQFKELDGASKLSSPGFEPLESGIAVGMPGEQIRTSRAVRRVIRYETIIIDNNFKRHVKTFFNFLVTGYAVLNEFLFTHFLVGNSASQSVWSKHQRDRMQPFDELITVQSPGFSVVFTADNRPVDAAATTFSSQAAAQRYLDDQVAASAGLSKTMHVVPNPEVNVGT
ncbi:MAG: DUF6603 domain-containing protein [Gemmatimonadales bacterium]